MPGKKSILILCIVFISIIFADFALCDIDGLSYSHSAIQEETFQAVFDVEDACFDFLGGNWQLVNDTEKLAYYYFTLAGPGDGSGKGRWIAEGLPAGQYLIEFWAAYGDYSADAGYEIVHADGITTETINMNFITNGWHPLGTFNLNSVCVVYINDKWSGAGSKISADALRFTMLSTVPPPPSSTLVPHIGVCIDDAGGDDPLLSSTPIYKMLRLPYKMTFAVMPNKTYTTQTANEVFNQGSEVILHQPMAAISVPNPGAGSIIDSMTLDQVRTTVSANLDAIPHAVGMNNHMGSLISQRRDKIQVCAEECKERNFYFYDSRTYTYSIIYDVAKENGLLTGERDLFIDGNSLAEAKELIRSLAKRALYAPESSILCIGHVRDNTAAALEEMTPELQAMGVELWPLSKCLSQIVESDFIPAGCGATFTSSWEDTPADCYSKELYDGNSKVIINSSAAPASEAVFTPDLQLSGLYDVYTIYSGDSPTTGTLFNSSQVKVSVKHKSGTTELNLDENSSPNKWNYLGRFEMESGSSANVKFDNSDCIIPDRKLKADAVKFVYTGETTSGIKLWMMY